MVPVKLRPYQINIINEIKKSWIEGFKSPCVVAPCGAGKSIVLAELAKRTTDKKNEVWFIVHRKELCDQIRNTFIKYGVNMDYCQVWMIQTLVRRLDTLAPPKLILVDENHHSKASSYKKVFDYTKCHKVGVTATPVRLDGSGFEDINDTLIQSVTAKWLIENKFLSPARVFSAPAIEIKGLNIKKGDYDAKQVEELMDTSVIYGNILKTWQDKALNKKTIAYCTTVNHSLNTAAMFNENGITAAHIDGKTNKNERASIIEKFRNGEIQVLCNCDIISEGFDVPDCECVILLRPTKSLTLYIQQSMRCMRYKEGKEAIILDHVANTYFHGLPWMDREWSLKAKEKTNKKKDTEKQATNNTWTCDICFNTWEKTEGRYCTMCGEEKITERELEIQEATELIEIKESMFKKARKEKREELKKRQEKRNYKKGWVWYQMQHFDNKYKKELEELKNGI